MFDAGGAVRIPQCEKRCALLLITLVAIAAVLMNLHAFSISLDPDEGAFATIAADILAGAVPYRDVFDHKGPGIYYLLALIFWLAGPLAIAGKLMAARALVVVANLITARLIYELGRISCSHTVGILAAILWLAFAPMFDGVRFYTEVFATPPLIAAALLSLYADRRAGMAAGFLLAVSALFKQTSLLAAPGLLLLGANPIALGIGFFAPWLTVFGAFTVAHGGQDFIDQVILVNLHYPVEPRGEWWGLLSMSLATSAIIFILDLYGIFLVSRARLEPSKAFPRNALAFVILQAGLCLPFLTHAYPHYWIQVLPWMSLLAALGLDHLTRRDAWNPLAGMAVLALLLTLATGFKSLLVDPRNLSEQFVTAARIRNVLKTGDSLLVAPGHPEYYFLTGRRPLTPYIYLLDINRDRFEGAFEHALTSSRFSVIAWSGDCHSGKNLIACEALRTHYASLDGLGANGSHFQLFKRRSHSATAI